MTLNGVKAVKLRYFTEFGKPVYQHITASIGGGIYAHCILYAVVRVQCRRNESSHLLSHLLMSFLFINVVPVGVLAYVLVLSVNNHSSFASQSW